MRHSASSGSYARLDTAEARGRARPAERKLAQTARMDNPLWYLGKAVFVYALVVLDLFLNSSVNSDSYDGVAGGRLNQFWPFLFLVLQSSVQLFIFLTIFLMMCNTYLMQIGLPGVVLSDFKLLMATQAIYLFFTATLGVTRIQGHGVKLETLWEEKGFEAAFVMQNLSAAFYYHQVLMSTFRLADEKYYTKCEM